MKTVLLYVRNLDLAKAEIKKFKGHLTQLCTPKIVIVNFPDEVNVANLKHTSKSIPKRIDKLSKLFVNGWRNRTKKKDRLITKWDDLRFQYPKNARNDEELATQERVNPPTTSSYMTGSIAIGLVIVSGEDASLTFSTDETNQVISEVMGGLQSLASFEPLANISFIYQTSLVSIDAIPSTEPCTNKESCESIWRDPALQILGVATGLNGVSEYNERLITNVGTQWAYMAFFTKYPQEHFAYAGSGRVCMEYSNDGWGPDQIDIVFAHETCHIFGAADEYSTSSCTCDGSGYYNYPNYNCENCNTDPNPKVNCLMNNNDISNICQWSRGQLGWRFKESFQVNSSYNKPALAMMNGRLYLAWRDLEDNLNLKSSSDNGNTWNEGSRINEKSEQNPALAVLDNRLYLAWTDTNNDLQLKSSGDGGNTWGSIPNFSDGIQSNQAPALAVLDGVLYVAWIGVLSQYIVISEIYLRSSTDGGRNWKAITTNASATKGPALGVLRDSLYLAYPVQSSLYLQATADKGTSWELITVDESSYEAPAVLAWEDTLYIAWSSTGSDLYIKSSSDKGQTWSDKLAINENSTQGPALIALNDVIHLSWTDMDIVLNLKSSTDEAKTWGDQKLFGEESSDSAPAVAVLDDTIYLAWTDMENKININYSEDNGVSWALKKKFNNQTSNAAPALGVMKDTLFLVWTNEKDELYIKSSSDGGTSWTNKKALNNNSYVAPALASFEDTLYMVWTNRQEKLFLKSTTDGKNWSDKIGLNPTTSKTPALAILNDILYLSWVESSMLYIMSSADGGLNWESPKSINVVTNKAPALASLDGTLYLTWKNYLPPYDLDKSLNMLSSANGGKNWNCSVTLTETSNTAPALCYLNNYKCMAWIDTNKILNCMLMH